MQILSIRGENIASLAKPFEIRLDEGPLASAGLFAITGETGAGKSSLLDTMCLALYGDCPRLSGGGTREAVADVEGHSLKATDPRMVLRRGAARGLAEVTFRAKDGEVYVAGWAARRARDRIGGRLQAVDRSLVRAADGQVLESQLSRVNDRVAELTGLTYDEFRRTVLLAQGDFDAFLSAQTGDRAAILEKVTGTQVYRDISRRIYERHSAAQAALETLETRRGEHRLLSAEERAALQAEAETLRTAQAETASGLAAVTAELARFEALEAAQQAVTRAEVRVTAAQATLAGLADQRAWLAEYDRAQGLRGELREARAAEQALSEASAASAQLLRDHAAQAERQEAAAAEAEAAQSRAEAQEALFKTLGPDWTRAEQLDSAILSANEELSRAEADLQARQGAAAQARADLAALEAEDSTLQARQHETRQALEAIPGQAALLTGWSVLEERLEARIAAAARLHEAETERQALQEAGRDRTQTRDSARQDAAELRDSLAAQRQAQAALHPERQKLQAEAPAEALATLSQQQIDLRSLRQAAARLREADQARADSAARQAEAAQARDAAAADQQGFAQALDRARHHVEALARPVASAQAAVSAEAAHLRQHLQPGTACPVCHATEHPVMDDSALSKLARDLRQQMEEALASRDRAATDLQAARSRQKDAEALIDREEAATSALAKAQAEALEEHGRQLAALQPSLPEAPADPRAPDATFAGLLADLEARRPALENARDRLLRLDRAHQQFGTDIEAAQIRLATLDDQIAGLTTALSQAETRVQALTSEIATAEREIAALAPRLAAPLAALGLSAETFGAEGQPALSRLRATARQAGTLQATLTETETARAALLPRLTEARGTARSATERAAEAAQTRDRRQAARDGLRSDRARLLGGEETGPHRTRHNEARKAAQQTANEARARRSDAAEALAGLAASVKAAQQTQARAEARHDSARTTLTEACAAAGLALSRVEDLLSSDTATVEAQRAALLAAETEATAAGGALEERRSALAQVQAEPLPEAPRDTLLAHRAALEDTAATQAEAQGRLAERADADTRARAALSGLEAEIETARKVADTWTAVNEAVGSARGDKFAQIAQAVTLRLLVERANLHLDQLKPRYQLAVADQDLALHVIDRDMAGDTRPSRLLSGGERFLVSLSLALALSGMGSRGALAGTLFIDEGFGSLDAESLDLAIDALERLQAQGRTIGVISHVQAMKDRIPVQLEVTRTGGGASEIALKLG